MVSVEKAVMGDLFLLSEQRMARISLHFPLSHGVPRVDDQRVISGIVKKGPFPAVSGARRAN